MFNLFRVCRKDEISRKKLVRYFCYGNNVEATFDSVRLSKQHSTVSKRITVVYDIMLLAVLAVSTVFGSIIFFGLAAKGLRTDRRQRLTKSRPPWAFYLFIYLLSIRTHSTRKQKSYTVAR